MTLNFNDLVTKGQQAAIDKIETAVGTVLNRIQHVVDDSALSDDDRVARIESLEIATRTLTHSPINPTAGALGSGQSATDKAVLDTFGDFAQATGIGADPLLRMLQPVLQPLAGLPVNEINARLIGASDVTKGTHPVLPDGRLDIKTDATLKADNDRLEKEVTRLTTEVTNLTDEVAKLKKERDAFQKLVEALQQATDPTKASSKAKAKALLAALNKNGDLTDDQKGKLTGKKPVYTP